MKYYDYAQEGCYFVTICVKYRENIFGSISDGIMRLSGCGEIADAVWNDLKNHNANVIADVYCVMPNHVHGIIGLVGNGSKPFREGEGHGLPEIIRQFKTFSARYINAYLIRNGLEPFPTMWQKSYHDHIIRDVYKYQRIWQYIDDNPAKWHEDRYYYNPIIQNLEASHCP